MRSAVAARFLTLRGSAQPQDGLDDRYAGHSGEIADDVVRLQVHLIQRLLHVCWTRLEAICTKLSRCWGSNAPCRPPVPVGTIRAVDHRMQILQPLTVREVRLASGHILYVSAR